MRPKKGAVVIMSLGRVRVLEALWRLPATRLSASTVCPTVCRPLSSAGARSGPTSPDPQEQAGQVQQRPAKNTSKAMMAYLERATKHEEFMRKQVHEFEIGKRHLANMMGEDPEHFTQEDVDRAIEYLFPTGIFDKKARPKMRHPTEVFPQQKAAQFDATGRPFHTLFYTLKPNFYMTLYELVEKMNQLDRLQAKNDALGKLPDTTQKLSLLGSEWLDIEELGKMLVETLKEPQYQEFVRAMNRLVEHPLAYHHKDFIFKYRKMLRVSNETDTVPELLFDSAGRPYMEATGYRKRAVARAVVHGRGSGRVTVNGLPLVHYFHRDGGRSGNQDVAQVMYPLQVAGVLDSVDVEATVQYDGPTQRYHGKRRRGHRKRTSFVPEPWKRPHPVQAPSSQAGAVRHAVSLALRSFVDKEMQETMRLAGLLTRDVRERERYKPGKKGSRKGRTWKKR
ncbi:28S ribosomal protein S9, mitochondrial-like isoform X2 [Amphibalanus amphitrite]|uniref:28S ribosomal protein S9, mitochondrial-like isoform X2 n=1 Tax=Amphibalanus amphitrite TaxID=1232801 RepID=UPI001C919B5E|nr:28S ribosomal protein S9, mitochondrial-like isoform X2 [Amphibalanus amphitrite]